jgi:hypothetical protein
MPESANPTNNIYGTSAGEETLTAPTGPSSVDSNGGFGDVLVGSSGDNTLTGGAGADTFHAFSGAGMEVVTDFNSAEGDRVQLDAGTTWHASQSGADVLIDMGNGDEMILKNVTLSALPSGWIFTL